MDRAWNLAAGIALPVLLLGAAALLVRPLASLTPQALAVAAWLPVLVGLSGIALAARFDRGRLLYCLLLMLVAFAVLRAVDGAVDGLGVRLTWAMTCLALPLALVAFAWLPDRGVLRVWTDQRALLSTIPVAIVVGGILSGRGSLLSWLTVPLGPLSGWSPVPPLAQLAFAVSAALLYGRFYSQPTIQRGALLGALVAGFVALHRATEPAVGVALLGAGCVLLTLAVLQESWSVAYVDPLTELPGRRALEEHLRTLGTTYAIAMLDVDHFKHFNDTHGHHVGDEVLRLVAAHLREVGGGGRPFRYGGEEFTVVFAGLAAADALQHLEALREEIAAARFALRRRDRRRLPGEPGSGPDDPEISVSVSIGLAGSRDTDRPHAVLEAADGALYAAKRAGRNRVERSLAP